MIKSPPTAVIPEIALVIDIRGVCRAGETPQTEKYPVMTESEKIDAMVRIAGLVHAKPRPRDAKIPAESPKALFIVFWNGVTSTAFGL